MVDLAAFDVDDKFWAHTSHEALSPETLTEHSQLTNSYYQKIIQRKNIDSIIDTLIKKVDAKNSLLIRDMFDSAIYLHDLGKTNPFFQAKKMHNPMFKAYVSKTDSSAHSSRSSDMYLEYFIDSANTLKSRMDRERLRFILYSFSYHIAKHHGRLSDFESYRDDENNVKSYFTHLKKFNIPSFEFYILNKMLFSLIVSSDYYATTEYMAKLQNDDFGLLSSEKKEQLKSRFYEFINAFPKAEGINKLRDEMFQEAEKNLLKNLDKNIFYLEAPTGSGKTIVSINLALQLLNREQNLNKLFYIFPFNTLVEQTKSVFDEIFGDDLDIEVINAITPIKEINQEDDESDYTRSYVNRLFFHSPAIITTHVSFFNILFGTSKEDNFPLWQLANSVIIIDEIQSYNNDLWWYMVEFFDKYAELLNMKIIIMSATLPKLDFFLEKKDNFIDLIGKDKRDYFFRDPFFKERVDVDYSLLDEGKISLERLEEVLEIEQKNYQKILFEFITKQSARAFYEQINGTYENVFELSGDDNKAYRQFVIDQTKIDRPIIVIATQVIEAGVDIDMDLGFKDISTLDSEEQFMGRINRSCKKKGAKVYFFDKDDASKIYRDDNRIGFDLKQEKYQTILKEKDYATYYEEVLAVIKKNGLCFDNGLNTNIDNFSELLQKLNYKEIAKTMTLIDSQNFTLYFPFKIDLSIYKGVKELENIDAKYLTDGTLDGQKVWEVYLGLQDIDSFVEKEVERSRINALVQFFTFNIIKFDDKSRPCIGDDIGGYYFIPDHEDLIDKYGKFNRALYQEKCKGIFL